VEEASGNIGVGRLLARSLGNEGTKEGTKERRKEGRKEGRKAEAAIGPWTGTAITRRGHGHTLKFNNSNLQRLFLV
jgi:hypothetical protein